MPRVGNRRRVKGSDVSLDHRPSLFRVVGPDAQSPDTAPATSVRSPAHLVRPHRPSDTEGCLYPDCHTSRPTASETVPSGTGGPVVVLLEWGVHLPKRQVGSQTSRPWLPGSTGGTVTESSACLLGTRSPVYTPKDCVQGASGSFLWSEDVGVGTTQRSSECSVISFWKRERETLSFAITRVSVGVTKMHSSIQNPRKPPRPTPPFVQAVHRWQGALRPPAARPARGASASAAQSAS